MTAPVDVLAVMDAHAALHAEKARAMDGNSGNARMLRELHKEECSRIREARAAVGELTDKARAAANVLQNAIVAGQIDRGYAPYLDELRAALARCGGAK